MKILYIIFYIYIYIILKYIPFQIELLLKIQNKHLKYLKYLK